MLSMGEAQSPPKSFKWRGIMNKKEKQFEKDWEKKYTQVHLDPEIYFPDERTFFIVTQEELEAIKEKTVERMAEYNRIKPQGWATYE